MRGLIRRLAGRGRWPCCSAASRSPARRRSRCSSASSRSSRPGSRAGHYVGPWAAGALHRRRVLRHHDARQPHGLRRARAQPASPPPPADLPGDAALGRDARARARPLRAGAFQSLLSAAAAALGRLMPMTALAGAGTPAISWTTLPARCERRWGGGVRTVVERRADLSPAPASDVWPRSAAGSSMSAAAPSPACSSRSGAEEWELRHVFYGGPEPGPGPRAARPAARRRRTFPSVSARVHAADWHEREAEDMFGLVFEGHPRLGDFILHDDAGRRASSRCGARSTPARAVADARARAELAARAASSRRPASSSCRSGRSSRARPSRHTSSSRRSART